MLDFSRYANLRKQTKCLHLQLPGQSATWSDNMQSCLGAMLLVVQEARKR